LTVDTGFADGEGTIKAHVSNNLSLGDQQIAAQFQEIPLDLRMVEAERIGCMYCLDFILIIYLFPLLSSTHSRMHLKRVVLQIFF
jgi:hypothetical protein